MNRQLSISEIDQLLSSTTPMTRRDKFLRFAELVRQSHSEFVIFNGLEYYQLYELYWISHPYSAFAMAARDPVLQSAGLTSDTVGAAMKFFELSKGELHEFSCDCGGLITNDRMASRIEQLANK